MEDADSNEDYPAEIMLVENSILRGADDDSDMYPKIIELRHPRTGLSAVFITSGDGSCIQEIFKMSGKLNSWFVDDTIKQEGDLFLSTPFDPCFLILPYLKKAKEDGRVIPLNDLLIDDTFPDTLELIKCSGVKNISMIADRKGDEDLNAWAYNEEKTLMWLVGKAEKVSKVLQKNEILAPDSNNLSNSSKNQISTNDTDLHLSYACGLVSEYLSDDLSMKLFSHFNFPNDIVNDIASGKRKSLDIVHNITTKKVKRGLEPAEKHSKSSNHTKDKSKIKAISGCRSITSFFK